MRSNLGVIALALIAGFAGGILSQQFVRPAQASTDGTITARSFRLVDAKGTIIAELADVKDPGREPRPALTVYGDGHKTQIYGDGVYFGRGYGDEDLGVGYADSTSPALFFWYKKKGRMGLMLDSKNEGAPRAFMYDGTGQTIWRAPDVPTKP
jgi:hypothetical protein